ncbi:hypothetical protein [Pseudactinotalea suaedae]|uniref:hypothetical protein n=1 Tax=Pseudactinotalea suaedae TaxID=1524924 RepID=UPI0012E1388F|nr:hypothetical protein [Pseudactinotalea suaedae]
MLLVVSGASGTGKTTARFHAAPLLGDRFHAVELWHYGPIPAVPTIAWRQESVERITQDAIALEAQGRHLLLAGDPIPAGEALAAPSADRIDVAVCLLDVREDVLDARLDAQDDPPAIRHLHHGFAAWLRHHATDPDYVPEAVTNDAWPSMQWGRWVGADVADRWAMTVVDASDVTPEQAGAAVADWARAAVAGDAPVFRAGWHR